MSASPRPTVAGHFANRSPEVRAMYRAVLAAVRKFGRVVESPNQGSIHLVRRTAFAGVAPRRDGLLLSFKSTTDIHSLRIVPDVDESRALFNLVKDQGRDGAAGIVQGEKALQHLAHQGESVDGPSHPYDDPRSFPKPYLPEEEPVT